MIRHLQDICLALVALFFPLYLFRAFFDGNDVWALALFPLAALLLTGEWVLQAAVLGAKWRHAVKDTSWMSRICNGSIQRLLKNSKKVLATESRL